MLFPCLISLMEIFFPFNFFLLSKIFLLSLYLPSLMIIDLSFSPAFFLFPMQCVLSISQSLIAKSKCSFIALMHSLSVFSCLFSRITCSRNQLCLEYFSSFSTVSECSSAFCANLETFPANLFMVSSLSFLCYSHESNFLVMQSTVTLSSCRCFLPLICFSFNSLVHSYLILRSA